MSLDIDQTQTEINDLQALINGFLDPGDRASIPNVTITDTQCNFLSALILFEQFKFSASPPTGLAPTAVVVGDVSTPMLAANTDRRFVVFTNNSITSEIFLAFDGETAVIDEGISLAKGGGQFTLNPAPTGIINAIRKVGMVANLLIQEFS